MPKAISENFSEKTIGRPRAFPREVEATMQAIGIGADATTRRGKVNRYYAHRAFGALFPAKEFSWLIDTEEHCRTGAAKIRWTILSELGRLQDPDTIRENARVICDQKMRTRDAVVLLRRLRAKPKAGSILGLHEELLGVVNDYCLRHPGFTAHQILAAIEDLSALVADHAAEL